MHVGAHSDGAHSDGAHSDISFLDRLLLNGLNLRIKLKRAKNVFCLVYSAAGANFKVVITKPSCLYVYHSKPCSCAKTLQRQVPYPQNRL